MTPSLRLGVFVLRKVIRQNVKEQNRPKGQERIRDKKMKKSTYFIRQEMAKTDASLARFFLFGGGIILLIAGIVYAYGRFIRTEPLTFYKNIEDCRVVTDYKTTRTRSRGRTKTRRHYYVYVHTPDGEDDVTMKVSRSYYNEMSKLAVKQSVKLSFFKTKSGNLFPSYTLGASASKAGHQYVECYPSAITNILLIVLGCAGVGSVSVGLMALRSFRRKSSELDVQAAGGIEDDISVNNEFMKEFDEALERDPYKYTRSRRSSHELKSAQEEKPKENRISARERDELLRQFDELTADGRYNYKSHL